MKQREAVESEAMMVKRVGWVTLRRGYPGRLWRDSFSKWQHVLARNANLQTPRRTIENRQYETVYVDCVAVPSLGRIVEQHGHGHQGTAFGSCGESLATVGGELG